MKGAVQTRFQKNDYQVLFEPDAYACFLAKAENSGLCRAIDDTKAGMLYWRCKETSYLWVTGIPSQRKDYIGTSIRFNLLLSSEADEDIRGWTEFFSNALSVPAKNQLKNLGKTWDGHVEDNRALKGGVKFADLLRDMEDLRSQEGDRKSLPFSDNDYLIVSPLISGAISMRGVLVDSSLHGSVWNQTCNNWEPVPTVSAQKKTPTLMVKALLLLVILTLLEMLLIELNRSYLPVTENLWTCSDSKSDSIEKYVQNSSSEMRDQEPPAVEEPKTPPIALPIKKEGVEKKPESSKDVNSTLQIVPQPDTAKKEGKTSEPPQNLKGKEVPQSQAGKPVQRRKTVKSAATDRKKPEANK